MNQDYDPDSAEARDCVSQPVGVHTLCSSPTNPRKSFPEAAMAELTASVKQHGVLTPIVVRCWPASYPWTGDMPLYEVVAGERRFRAAKAAELRLIPAMVRHLTDEQVLEIQVIENLQREGVHPLEEAEGYELMMSKYGYTADQIAEKVDKSRSYIFGRLKLLALDAESRRLFSGGLLNASTALLVARIPTAALRAKAVKEITEKDYSGDMKSVRQAQRWIRDRYTLKLADATFPIDDTALCGGACTACPKRTGNAPEVFDDIDSPDVCTDPDCFQAKKSAFMLISIAKAKADGAQVITGKDAKKIAPHGIHSYSRLDNFTQLDDKCYEDPEKRTYRAILGDSVEAVLVEDKEHDRLVPLIANTVLADKLKEAGIVSGEAKRDDEAKKRKAQIDLERAYRERLFSSVRAELDKATLPGVPTLLEAASSWILMRAAEQLFTRLYSEVQARIATLWRAEGKNPTERNKHFLADTLPSLNAGELWRLLVDLTTAGCTLVSEYSIDHEPKALLDMATLFNIDPAQVRKDAVSAQKDAKKVGKSEKPSESPAKKSKNPASAPHVEALPVTKAAQASDSLSEKSENSLKVGYRVRIRDGAAGTLAWRKKNCGREGIIEGLVDDWNVSVRIAPGPEGLIEPLTRDDVERIFPAANATQAGETAPDNAWQTLKIKSEELVEMNEKPTPADALTPVADDGHLAVGDLVRIRNGLKGMAGKLRKCCGREGVIERLAGAYIHVRTAPGVNGLITNLARNEVDKLASATHAAPAAVAKVSRSRARSAPAKRQPAKNKKVLNEETVHA